MWWFWLKREEEKNVLHGIVGRRWKVFFEEKEKDQWGGRRQGKKRKENMKQGGELKSIIGREKINKF